MVAGQPRDRLHDAEAGRTVRCIAGPITHHRRYHHAGAAAGSLHPAARRQMEYTFWSIHAAYYPQWLPAEHADKPVRAVACRAGDGPCRRYPALAARSFTGTSAALRVLCRRCAGRMVRSVFPDPGSHTGNSLVAAVMGRSNHPGRAGGGWIELLTQSHPITGMIR